MKNEKFSRSMDIVAKRRKRTVLSAKQQKILMKSFEECAFPDAKQRLALGKILNMTPRTIQIWFQNQRQKIKSYHQDPRNTQSGEESVESIETIRRQSSIKSLNALAHLACIEYDRKFGKKS